MPVCFLMRDRRGKDQDGREDREKLEGILGRETVSRIYFIKKKKLFSVHGERGRENVYGGELYPIHGPWSMERHRHACEQSFPMCHL